MATRIDPRITCLHLRCKQMFYEVDDPARDGEKAGASSEIHDNWHWCSLTQTGRGPDEKPVGRKDCSHGGRSCFEGLGHIT